MRTQMTMTSATHSVSFRAPPPSPVAPGRQSPFTNVDILTEYLDQSLIVPDLILPDRVFPRQKSVQNPPKIDLQNLGSPENNSGELISELVAQTGCLEVTNHGISRDLIKLALFLASGIFEISPEKKRTAARSPERRFGFEEFHGGGEDESEEFLWCGDERTRLEMEGIWPFGYSNFSQVMERLCGEIEEVGSKILQFLEQSMKKQGMWHNNQEEVARKSCYIQKHSRKAESMRYEVMRMLIRGSEIPHALCLHVSSSSSTTTTHDHDFHVYSKKGWLCFCPHQDSILVTVGDLFQQAWSGGQYKHVIGRPVFKGEDERCISMGFLFSPQNLINSIKDDDDEVVTISLNQQILFAVLVTIIYQVFDFVYYFLFKRQK